MCTGTHLCFSQAHFRTFSALFPPFSAFCGHFSPVTVCFVKINISFGEIRFLPVYSKRDRRAPVSFAVNRQKTDFAKRNVYFDKTDGYGGKVAAKCGEWREKC